MKEFTHVQKRIFANKEKQGFNTSNVEMEFCYTYEELAEAYHAYRQELPDVGEELADVAIYLFGMAEILGVDLGEEIEKKMEKNEKRKYVGNELGGWDRIEGE